VKSGGRTSPYIIVDVCVRCRREGTERGNNIICPCGGSNKSLNGPDRFSQRNDIELGG